MGGSRFLGVSGFAAMLWAVHGDRWKLLVVVASLISWRKSGNSSPELEMEWRRSARDGGRASARREEEAWGAERARGLLL